MGGIKVGGNVRMLPIAQGNTTVADLERDWMNRTGSVFSRGDREYAVVYDPNSGEIPVVYEGDRHSVNVRPLDTEREGATLTHFHPDRRFGGTLSTQDLRMFTNSQLAEIRAVTSSGQVFGVRAGANANRQGLSNWLRSRNNVLQRNFRQSYTAAMRRALEGRTVRHVSPTGKISWTLRRDSNGNVVRMNREQALAYARQVSTGAYDRAYRNALERFGFTYYKRKL